MIALSVKQANHQFLTLMIVPCLVIAMFALTQTYPNPRWLHATVASMLSKSVGQMARQAPKANTSNRPSVVVPSTILTSPSIRTISHVVKSRFSHFISLQYSLISVIKITIYCSLSLKKSYTLRRT